MAANLEGATRLNPISEELRSLLTWIADNLRIEPLSGILPPLQPAWNVSAEDLLDAISECFNVDKREIGDIVNPVREYLEGDHGR